MSIIEFKPWPKTPRLFRDCTVTEKIDGTNAAIHVVELQPSDIRGDWSDPTNVVNVDGKVYRVAAQSRKRLITPEADNFGFARWVWENAAGLVQALGTGVHYGEWWGPGIQRGYGLTERQFSLFNTHRYDVTFYNTPMWGQGLSVVPILFQGAFSTDIVKEMVSFLASEGSVAAPGFMDPEGVIVYHSSSQSVYKVLIENDNLPKGIAS